MAKVQVQKAPVVVQPEDTVTLEVTMTEAEAIMALIGKTNGAGDIDLYEVWQALTRARISDDGISLTSDGAKIRGIRISKNG